MASPPRELLVLPVGQYLGAAEPNGRVVADYRVRVGARRVHLEAGDPVAVWLLAHGLPEWVGDRLWTYDAMARAVAGIGAARLDAAVQLLERDGLLVRVAAAGQEGVEVAHRYRLRPLLIGLGWRPEWGGYAVGLHEPIAAMTEFVSLIWRWAPAANTLWTLCEAIAYADRFGGEPEAGDPAEILADVLRSIHLILANRAGFLDEV